MNFYQKYFSLFKVKKKQKFGSIGKHVLIEKNGLFSKPANIYIGNYIYIGPNCNFNAFSRIIIKNGSIIGPNCIIYTANHNYDDSSFLPYDEKLVLKDVIINENVWIGGNVIIVPGVQIGEGSVVAAGSVITKDIPPMSIVGGNPAKVIKKRNQIKYNQLKKTGAIYLKYKYEKKHFNN